MNGVRSYYKKKPEMLRALYDSTGDELFKERLKNYTAYIKGQLVAGAITKRKQDTMAVKQGRYPTLRKQQIFDELTDMLGNLAIQDNMDEDEVDFATELLKQLLKEQTGDKASAEDKMDMED